MSDESFRDASLRNLSGTNEPVFRAEEPTPINPGRSARAEFHTKGELQPDGQITVPALPPHSGNTIVIQELTPAEPSAVDQAIVNSKLNYLWLAISNIQRDIADLKLLFSSLVFATGEKAASQVAFDALVERIERYNRGASHKI